MGMATASRLRSGSALAAGLLVVAELVLRISGYRISPVDLLPAQVQDDVRAAYVSGHELTRFDPELMWTLDGASAASGGVACTDPAAPRRDPQARLVVVLGDTSACEPASARWTAQLQRLLDLNADGGPRNELVDAGVPGYSSVQGLGRFHQVLERRPEVVFFEFGAADAQYVRLSDAAYAARVRRFSWLAASRVTALAARGTGLLGGEPHDGARAVPRVSRQQYLEHAREFVARARRAHVVPVLVPPQGAGSVATYAADIRSFAAEDGVLVLEHGRPGPPLEPGERDSPERAFGKAVSALELLNRLGLVSTDRVLDRAVEPGRVGSDRMELGRGFWDPETWEGGQAGRWTSAAADVRLERRASEGGLALEASFLHPRNDTRLRVEVDGVTVGVIEAGNGLVHRTLDIRSRPGRRLAIRLAAERPFLPGAGDTRTLGVFLHRLALVPGQHGTDLLPAEVASGTPELGSGWWLPEEWSDGQRGRWTHDTATLRLERRSADTRLLLDLSGGHPDGKARLRVDINGAFVERLEVRNSAATYAIDLAEVSGEVLDVRLTSEQPFVPRQVRPDSNDERRLGVFVRSVRLAGAFI